MKIRSLKLYDGLFRGEYDFDNLTVLLSKHNKAGKTTLLRCLLYALGYQIPSTRGISFERMNFEIVVISPSGKEFTLSRHNDSLILHCENNEELFSLPYDQIVLHQKLFEIDEPFILDNLLGTFYMDQEKGWTLLNRGKVIGNIRFNIEDFMRGLIGDPCKKECDELDAVSHELRKYKQMLEVAKYQIDFDASGDVIPFDTPAEELYKELHFLRNEKKPLENELMRLQNTIRKTTSFKKFIAGMRLRVRSETGSEIDVNEDTIIDFHDHEQFLKSKRDDIIFKISQIDNKIGKLSERITDNQTLFNVETTIENFATELSNIKIDKDSVERIISQLTQKKKVLEDIIHSTLIKSDSVIKELTGSIQEYLKFFGIDDKYGNDIFTHDLKSLSGANFHLLVFAFKISYVKMIYAKTGCVLPIILDSPSGREVEISLVNKMMEVLTRDFSQHQIIIATIYDPKLPKQKTILLNQGIMEIINEN